METALNFATEKLNSVRHLSMEAITPIHVGAANDKLLVEKLDYLVEDDHVHILDKRRVFERLIENDLLDTYTQKLLQAKGGDLWDLLDDMDVDIKDVSVANYTCRDAAAEIRPLVRNGMGKPYVPGSSLKGALRSVVFEHLARQKDLDRLKSNLKNFRNSRDAEREVGDFEKHLIGGFSEAIFRFVRPADAVMDKTALMNIWLFNLYQQSGNWQSDYKDGFKISAEVFPKGAKGQIRIDIANGLIHSLRNSFGKHKDSKTPTHWDTVFSTDDPFRALFAIVNGYTKKHLQREIAFFQKYDQADDTDLIISNLQDLLQHTEREDTCLLRMAYGSGFHGITGDWRYDDHTYSILKPDEMNHAYSQTARGRVPARYKSRKIVGTAEHSSLMGFLKLAL